MTEAENSKPKRARVPKRGDRLSVPSPAVIVDPLGVEHRVIGGVFIVEHSGKHVIRKG